MNIACHKCKGEQLSLAAYPGSVRRVLTSLPILILLSGPILAAPLGMATDHETDKSHQFETETRNVLATLQESSGRINGDCAISNDETRGFSSNANHMVSVLQFSKTTLGQSVDLTSIDISNAGVDMSLSPDGALLVTTGAGNVDQPLSIIDTVSLQEVATITPFLDHTSAEFCDDGTLLVTTTYGNSFASPFDNAMYDARVSPDGDRMLLIMDPENGEQTGLLQAGDATGVCFAQRQPYIPQRLVVSTAP